MIMIKINNIDVILKSQIFLMNVIVNVKVIVIVIMNVVIVILLKEVVMAQNTEVSALDQEIVMIIMAQIMDIVMNL